MESLINWLIIFLLSSLFWFWMYIRERRKSIAWMAIVKEYQQRIKRFAEVYYQGRVNEEIDQILEDAENNSDKPPFNKE